MSGARGCRPARHVERPSLGRGSVAAMMPAEIAAGARGMKAAGPAMSRLRGFVLRRGSVTAADVAAWSGMQPGNALAQLHFAVSCGVLRQGEDGRWCATEEATASDDNGKGS